MTQRRVLVLTDNLHLLRMYSRVLRKSRHEVIECVSVTGARVLLNSERFDVFICDLTRGNSLDLLNEYAPMLKAQNTRIVVVSGKGRQITAESGAEHVLTKPVLMYELDHLTNRLANESPANDGVESHQNYERMGKQMRV